MKQCCTACGPRGVLLASVDITAAEEARVVAEEMGCSVIYEYDVGVAGIHRLFPCLERMAGADALVVAAGREGTLPAVVAELVEALAIGLPVSTGYGLGGGGAGGLILHAQVLLRPDCGQYRCRICGRGLCGEDRHAKMG